MDSGFYSAQYFKNTARVLRGDEKYDLEVKMQVFQKKKDTVIAGIDPILTMLSKYSRLKVSAVDDGHIAQPWEPIMFIEGPYADFAHLESVYLGILARCSKVATNARRVVEAANGKEVIFMGDRFDIPDAQGWDGYAVRIGGIKKVVTMAMTGLADEVPVGTMPHGLIAAYGGDVVEACKAYQRVIGGPITALVDFNNDCYTDAVRCVKEFGKDLYAVRLDTSENMVDRCIADDFIGLFSDVGDFKPTGVNTRLVEKVRQGLDAHGGRHVKIIVSGGFTPEKIREFETCNVKDVRVDVYGVGSSILQGNIDFTADIVYPVAKAGRRERYGAWGMKER